MNLKKLLLLALVVLGLSSCGKYSNLKDGIYAEITLGKDKTMLVELNYKATPMTVGNFVALAEGTMEGDISPELKGKKYFDGLKFHRVIQDFMIQTGDPDGTGSGGPGYLFPIEIVDSLTHNAGVISMANYDAFSNGSQFFITEVETPWLDGKHTVFGALVDTAEVAKVKSINQGDVMTSVKIIRRGAEAKAWDAYKAFSENLPVIKSNLESKIKAEEEAANKKMEEEFKDAKVTESGLKIVVNELGKGKLYKAGETAWVHYTGRLASGTVFDSSKDRGPFSFALGQGRVIKGWDEAVALIPQGSKATIYLPSAIAYGENGAGGVIPPNANLIFDIEVLTPQN